MEYITNDKLNQPSSAEASYEEEESYDGHTGYAEHRMHDADEYLEFESTYESHEEDAPVSRGDRHVEDEWGSNSSNASSSYQNQNQSQRSGGGRHHASRHEGRYNDENSGGSSAATAAAKDAQAFLRKQTEQAYDFAKKISMEDAKKGASETAKKAKKWGGSLLSSISASISSATNAAKV